MERRIIYLDDAIDALRYAQHRFTVADEAGGMGTVKWSEDVIYFAAAERVLAELPSAQPDITDEQAIGHLQASGWMQSHDKQMYEMGLKERLADDSDSYDALLPSAQPTQNERVNSNNALDTISRQAAIDALQGRK